MRISTNFTQELGINAMMAQQAKVAKSQMQMAAGLRILSPADDPAGAVRALALQESIAATDQYQTNVTMARSRLSQEESALEGVGNALQRLNELALQGANDTLVASDRHSIAVEARQLLSQLVDQVNAKTDGGEYLFGGFVSTTPPFAYQAYQTGAPPVEVGGAYVYQGDSQQHSTMIGPSFRITDSDPGDAAFMIDTSGGVWPPVVPPSASRPWITGSPASTPPMATPPEADILNVIANFAANMGDNTPDPMDIERIQRAMNQVRDVRVTVGARLSALDSQESLNLKFITDEKSYLSATQDLDYTEAISRFNLQSFALQAAQQAYVRVQGLSLFKFLG